MNTGSDTQPHRRKRLLNMRPLPTVVLVLVLAMATFSAWVWWVNLPLTLAPVVVSTPAGSPSNAQAELVARGAYLARAGNCLHCHTQPGGAPGAGGHAIHTPFGAVFSGNLTPHVNGLGGWTANDFWRALHEGRSRNGRALLPAFPYTEFTLITRADSDALFAYLQSLPAAPDKSPAHQLRWPFGQNWAVAVWRALYFRPQTFKPNPDHDAAWNRGAYLVQGLGHCAACHTPRNRLGALLAAQDFSGAQLPSSGWVAPALQAGYGTAQMVALLKTGQSAHGSALGPMAEVVLHSTQHLSDGDLAAMAQYVVASSQTKPGSAAVTPTLPDDPSAHNRQPQGAELYRQHCADCHGAQGDGNGRYPAFAGNHTLAQIDPSNLIKIIREGGFAPNTAANPRPFGMPPFGHVLGDADIAAVASFVRARWAGSVAAAAPVSQLQVLKTP